MKKIILFLILLSFGFSDYNLTYQNNYTNLKLDIIKLDAQFEKKYKKIGTSFIIILSGVFTIVSIKHIRGYKK